MNKNEVFILTVTDDVRDSNRLAEETIAVCSSFEKAIEIMEGDKENRVWFTPNDIHEIKMTNVFTKSFWLESETHDDDVYVVYTITRWEVM